ncbi:MAG: GlxA family transcriptional regulator [Pseudomonadota bacterium]
MDTQPAKATMDPRPEPFDILIIAAPDFNLAATTAFIDPFRAANYLEGAQRFRWTLSSEIGGAVTASNGLTVEAAALPDARERPDLAMVSSSWAPERHSSPGLRAYLRRLDRKGVRLGALDTGAFILADAGLLSGRRATVHYEHIDAMRELHGDVEVTEDLFVADWDRVTCCGGEASADLALQIVSERLGAPVADAAARYIFHTAMRPYGAQQAPSLTEPLTRTVPETVRAAIRLMEAHLEEPLSVGEIGARLGVSERHLARLFARHLGMPTMIYYRDIRLDRARGLVTQTEVPLLEVAIASGFRSQVAFSRAYKARFGLAPSADRREGRVPFEFRPWPMHPRRIDALSG